MGQYTTVLKIKNTYLISNPFT